MIGIVGTRVMYLADSVGLKRFFCKIFLLLTKLSRLLAGGLLLGIWAVWLIIVGTFFGRKLKYKIIFYLIGILITYTIFTSKIKYYLKNLLKRAKNLLNLDIIFEIYIKFWSKIILFKNHFSK